MNIHTSPKFCRPVLGAAILSAVALGSVVVASQGAFARVPDDSHSTDANANYCYFLQEEYGQAIDAWANAPEGSQAKHDAGERLGRVKAAWAADCHGDFGNVYARLGGQVSTQAAQNMTHTAVRR